MSQSNEIQNPATDTQQSRGLLVHPYFDVSRHVDYKDEILVHRAHGMLIVIVQAGRIPAVVVMEMNPVARLNVYDSVCEFEFQPEQFSHDVVLSLLKNRHNRSLIYGHFVILVPMTELQDSFEYLWASKFCESIPDYSLHIRRIPSKLQNFGIISADRFMSQQSQSVFDNQSKLLICSKNAFSLVDALSKNYYYVEDNNGNSAVEVNSNAGKLAAAFHYGCLFAERRGPYGAIDPRADPVVIENPAGWT